MMHVIARSLVIVVVPVLILHVARVAVLVGMDVKHADQEEHREQANHHPARRPVHRALLGYGMRQQVQERYAEHQAADKAHHELRPAVRELHQPGQRPAG
jgi:hypothetical protein